MAVYTIHFAKVGEFELSQAGVESELQVWFEEVIRLYRPRGVYNSVAFSWHTGEAEIVVPDREIIVYMMYSRRRSLWRRFGLESAPPEDGAGITMVNNGLSCCEVYCGCRSSRFISETVFHEALHNKTGWDDNRLHSRGGIASEDSTSITGAEVADGQEDYYSSNYGRARPTGATFRRLLCRGVLTETVGPSILTRRNYRDMATHLGDRRPQWGLGLVPPPTISLDGDDPLEGL